jgi:hypothetical protein
MQANSCILKRIFIDKTHFLSPSSSHLHRTCVASPTNQMNSFAVFLRFRREHHRLNEGEPTGQAGLLEDRRLFEDNIKNCLSVNVKNGNTSIGVICKEEKMIKKQSKTIN